VGRRKRHWLRIIRGASSNLVTHQSVDQQSPFLVDDEELHFGFELKTAAQAHEGLPVYQNTIGGNLVHWWWSVGSSLKFSSLAFNANIKFLALWM
jgi:hypothetical protein